MASSNLEKRVAVLEERSAKAETDVVIIRWVVDPSKPGERVRLPPRKPGEPPPRIQWEEDAP